jgi:hypothetical protein
MLAPVKTKYNVYRARNAAGHVGCEYQSSALDRFTCSLFLRISRGCKVRSVALLWRLDIYSSVDSI